MTTHDPADNRPAPQLTELDFATTINTAELPVPVDGAPVVLRVDLSRAFTLGELAMAHNALVAEVERLTVELADVKSRAASVSGVEFNSRTFAAHIEYIYDALNLKPLIIDAAPESAGGKT
jgi:hypothetical protein